MAEQLFIIDADARSFECTRANKVLWGYPLEGEWIREEPALHERLSRPRPHQYIGSRENTKQLTLHFGILASTRAELLATLETFLWRSDPVRGQFTVKRVTTTGNTRHMTCIRTSYAAPDPNAISRFSHAIPFTISVEAADPMWFDPVDGTASGAFNGSTEVDVSVINSNVETWPVMVFSGDVAWPKATNAAGKYIQLSGEISDPNYLRLDFDPDSDTFGAWMHSGDSSTNWTGRAVNGSEFFRLPAGTNDLEFDANSGDATITITFPKFYKEVV